MNSLGTASGVSDAANHRVQFYDDEHYICRVVADLVELGTSTRQPVIVVAAPEHRQALTADLANRGLDAAALRRQNRLLLIDARQTLESFLVGGRLDARLFHAVITSMIERVRGNSDSQVLVYGEMVDLLCREGRPETATELEELWNRLLRSGSCSLLCGYSLKSFCEPQDLKNFEQICRLHGQVAQMDRQPGGRTHSSAAQGRPLQAGAA